MFEWIAIVELLDHQFLGVKLWLLVGLPFIAIISILVSKLLTTFLKKIVRKVLSYSRLKNDTVSVSKFIRPLRWLIAVLIFKALKHLIELEPEHKSIISDCERSFMVFIIVWLAFVITDNFLNYTRSYLKKDKRSLALTALPLISRVLKIIFVLIGLLFLLQNYGVNVGAIVAGLGLGGLAFALAAQKTLENFFGGVVLILDQPLKVGDNCRVGTFEGTVEDIGLRSSRIRTTERTLVTIPNSDLYQSKIENLTDRDRFHLNAQINISLSTKPESLKSALEQINEKLKHYPKIELESCRARLIKFGEYYSTIELFGYILTKDFNEFSRTREQIYMDTLQILDESGCILNQKF